MSHKDSLASVPWHVRVNLDVKDTSVIKTPSPTERLQVLRRCYEELITNRVACRGDT